jgi:putative hydrolase of HD superfamily
LNKEGDSVLKTITDSSLRNLVKFLEITGILKQTQRAGWVDVGVYQPESVADHTFRTAFLCMLYADMEALDPLKLLRMALIHDLPEAVIGDLMPSQKTAETKQNEDTWSSARNAERKLLSCLGRIPRRKNERSESRASA